MTIYKVEPPIDAETAQEYELMLRTLWELMVLSNTNVLVPKRSDECLELYRHMFEAHQYATALHNYHWSQPVVHLESIYKARHLVSAFSALIETQYPFLTTKYRSMLSNSDLLDVLNMKMHVQYAARLLGPETVESNIHLMS